MMARFTFQDRGQMNGTMRLAKEKGLPDSAVSKNWAENFVDVNDKYAPLVSKCIDFLNQHKGEGEPSIARQLVSLEDNDVGGDDAN